MISKNKIKTIQSLKLKKNREKLNLFVAEGIKTIQELIVAGFEFEWIAGTNEALQKLDDVNCEQIETDHSSIKKASFLSNPQDIIAVCKMPKWKLNQEALTNQLSLVLDDIQDPGNLGTIIRIASWFGIKSIICSENTVDCFNPKVVQASMGALAHVKIHYTELEILLSNLKNSIPVYGTFLEGNNIYSEKLSDNGVIVMGNEGNGISFEVEKLVTRKLLIPSTNNEKRVESLNVSIATSIVCSEFKRRLF